MKTAVWLVVLGLLATGRLMAQESRLFQKMDTATAARVMALADSARALGLPVEPVVQKAMEGASKGAGPDEIVDAVRGLLRDLSAAREALGDDVSPEALQLGAAALAAGAVPGELAVLRDQRRKPGFQGALAGVVYLLSRGVPADSAVEIVASMLDAGLTQAEFQSLQRLVEQDVRGGVPSTDAAAVRARALILHGRGGGPGGGAVR